VREDLAKADWVSLKIDTVRENVWTALNQPAKGIKLEHILKGIEKFAAEYKGRLHTESMLTEGFNDDIAGLLQTSAFIAPLKPETAYLSVPVRPPAEKRIKPASESTLFTAWNIFNQTWHKN
jgi:wyosine [tRNA(Phe)-imidazoG37] synthetase (radical SAM superfamily)